MQKNGELDGESCRRLVIALMLRACLDAKDGDPEALGWIYSRGAAHLADLVNYEHLWPPAPSQLAKINELKSRARLLAPVPEFAAYGWA